MLVYGGHAVCAAGELSCKTASDNFANLEARLSIVIVLSRSK